MAKIIFKATIMTVGLLFSFGVGVLYGAFAVEEWYMNKYSEELEDARG